MVGFCKWWNSKKNEIEISLDYIHNKKIGEKVCLFLFISILISIKEQLV